MSEVIKLQLPFPPSVNAYWRHVVIGKSARAIISARGRKFRQAALLILESQKKSATICGHVSVALTLYPPDKKKRDLDNYVKAVLDVITCGKIWEDDSQVKKLSLAWGETRKGGLVQVDINLFESACQKQQAELLPWQD